MPQISAGTQPLASLSSDSKKVTYRMSNITSLVYELTYAGFKEDIVVEEYTGQTEYEFTLYTNGLTLCEEYGSYYLADADGKVKATIGDIIVFTADERNNTMGSMTYETVRANQEYILTIHLDAEYLADEDTLYPIRIDPTIEINYDNNGAGAIEDVTISPTQTFSGTSGALNIGRIPSGGISRALMRFPNLSLSGISPTQITAASVELRDLMCQGDEDITVECRIYNNSAPSWSESGTTTWSSVGTSYLGSLLDSHVISFGQGNVDGERHRYSFNILTAAKAWASGTQSQAKGLVFKANDAFENQTGDDVKSWYKIFASYNRSNYKPSLSITYNSVLTLNYGCISVVEGGTQTLTATTSPAGQAVTWSTNNSTVATVSSTGVVTARKAGKAIITARIIDSNGTTITATCNVYVYISNGVYYIKNLNSNYYMHVNLGGIDNSTDVCQHQKYDDIYDETYKIRQMWRVQYLNYGLYSIRPMHKLNMGLCIASGNVEICDIGTRDTLTAIPTHGLWSIEWRSTGYVLKNQENSNKTVQVKDASRRSGETIIASDYSTSLNCMWEMAKITKPPTGAYLYDISTGSPVSAPTKYVAPKESRSLYSFKLEPAFYSSTNIKQDFYWYSSNTLKATVNSATGEVKGVSPGTVTITGRKYYNGVYYYITYTVSITEIPNGAYYLENKQTGYYADINGSTMDSGKAICQWEHHGANSQQWVFKHLGDGYYSIKSSKSPSTYYMGVINDSSELDVDVVLRSGTISDGMKWKITSTSNGTYKIAPKTGISSGYVLATTTSSASNGHKLIQGAFLNDDSYRGEWLLVPYSVVLYGITNTGHDHISCLNTLSNTMLNSNWNDVIVRGGTIASSTCKNDLLSCNVFTSRSHGHWIYYAGTQNTASTGIILDDNSTDSVAFYSHSWSSMSSGSTYIQANDNYTGLTVALFIGCNTAKGGQGDRNLPSTIVEHGASASIGFSETIDCEAANEWTTIFYNKMLQGATLQEAVEFACNSADEYSGLKSAVICGDSTIAFPIS